MSLYDVSRRLYIERRDIMKLRHLKQFGMLLITSLVLSSCQNQITINQGVYNQMYHLKENDDLLVNKIEIENSDDEIALYYDGDVVLIVNEHQRVIEKDIDYDQVFGDVLSVRNLFDLYQSGNRLIVTSIRPINKYGESSRVTCYDISDGIKEIWSSEDFFDDENYFWPIVQLDEDQELLMVEFENKIYEMQMNKIYSDEIYAFLKELKTHTVEPAVVHNYDFQDINNDGNKELILEVYITMGASPLKDTFYATYRFSDKGIEYLDGWFKSKDTERTELLQMNNY